MTLDLSGPLQTRPSIALNGVTVGACSTGEIRTCSVDVQPAPDAGPVSTLTTSGADGMPIAVRKLMFRGARIERFKGAAPPAASPSR